MKPEANSTAAKINLSVFCAPRVERRRIYDVVNILESIGGLARKAKDLYSWKGFGAIPQALNLLKEESLRENSITSGSTSNSVLILVDNENAGSSSADIDGQDNYSTKKDIITLDNVAMALIGETYNSTAMRTKVRRLYDIANIFSFMNLIEKTHHQENRRPAFKWLGWRGKPCKESVTALDLNEPKKRVFGAEIANYGQKKNKVDLLTNGKSYLKVNAPMHAKHYNLEYEDDKCVLDHHLQHWSKGFVDGPFALINVPRVGDSGNKNVKWGSKREEAGFFLFVLCILIKAWKTWYAEVGDKERIHKRS